MHKHPPQSEAEVAKIAFSYQEAIVAALARRVAHALASGRYRSLALGGGVSLNGRLRVALAPLCQRAGIPLLCAEARYCGDNAAMIAGVAPREAIPPAPLELDIDPSWPI